MTGALAELSRHAQARALLAACETTLAEGIGR